MHTNKARPHSPFIKRSNLERKNGSQEVFSHKSYVPRRKLLQLSRDARHTGQQEWAVVGADRFRRNSNLGRRHKGE